MCIKMKQMCDTHTKTIIYNFSFYNLNLMQISRAIVLNNEASCKLYNLLSEKEIKNFFKEVFFFNYSSLEFILSTIRSSDFS